MSQTVATTSTAHAWGVESTRRPFKGDEVVIPKGAWITGTHKDLPKNAGRTYTVTIDGYSDYDGTVTWAGAGGYWHRTIEWCWPEQWAGRSNGRKQDPS